LFNLEFTESASKQFSKLDPNVCKIVAQSISKRLKNPHIASSRLGGHLAGYYKIKLNSIGLRVIYRVEDDIMTVVLVRIGKRQNFEVYKPLP